jgi:hypothetical protein
MTWYGMLWFTVFGGCLGFCLGYIVRSAQFDGGASDG